MTERIEMDAAWRSVCWGLISITISEARPRARRKPPPSTAVMPLALVTLIFLHSSATARRPVAQGDRFMKALQLECEPSTGGVGNNRNLLTNDEGKSGFGVVRSSRAHPSDVLSTSAKGVDTAKRQ